MNWDDPQTLQKVVKYVQSFDSERWKCWVNVSQKLDPVDNAMASTLQGLGKIDCRLVVEDTKIIQHEEISNPFGDLGDHLTQSYLWILGTYEILRALNQRMKNDLSIFPSSFNDIQLLKRKFERLRMPLAKFEAAKRHEDSDYGIAMPGIDQNRGVAWCIADDVWIKRRDLSDNFLVLMEGLEA